ncbi:MAG TPA: lytic transglycosylase domain-containing protein [Thermomicrobiales bacterium]|nr:lytic transglycosylase domain-containing protein [Thermomicrobiales bacterium]
MIDAAHRYGWNPNLIMAMAWQESYWRQDEVSWTGAIGVMQIMPETAQGMVDWYFGHDMNIWYSAYDNIEMGVAFLTVLYEETGSVELALASYYQGWSSVQHDGFFPDTREYVDRIMMFRDEFQAGNLP